MVANVRAVRQAEAEFKADPSQFLPQDRDYLTSVFSPRSVAVVPIETDTAPFTPDELGKHCSTVLRRLETLAAQTTDVPDQIAIAKAQSGLTEKLVELAERATALAAPSDDVSTLNRLSPENRKELMAFAEQVYREGKCPMVFTFGPPELHEAHRRIGPKAVVDWIMSQSEGAK